MPKIRFTVSLEKELLDEFDEIIDMNKYASRSEAIRDLIRDQLIQDEWASGSEVIGNITLVYNHHERDISREIVQLQHEYSDEIISTQHIHIDHDNCLEVIIVRGGVQEINELYNLLKSSRGVKQCELVRSTTGELIQ